jgi:hypothetical protein
LAFNKLQFGSSGTKFQQSTTGGNMMFSFLLSFLLFVVVSSTELEGINTICSAGLYKSGKKCLPCPMGHISAAGATECIGCPAGTHTSHHLTCDECKPGEYSQDYWRECEFCNSTSISQAGASECYECMAYYSFPDKQENVCVYISDYFQPMAILKRLGFL